MFMHLANRVRAWTCACLFCVSHLYVYQMHCKVAIKSYTKTFLARISFYGRTFGISRFDVTFVTWTLLLRYAMMTLRDL